MVVDQEDRDRIAHETDRERRWRRIVDVAHVVYAGAAAAYAVAAWYEIFAA